MGIVTGISGPGGGLTEAQVDARVALYAPTSGTFTPVIQDADLSDAEGQTYSIQNGWYRVINDLVFFGIDVEITSLGTLSTGAAVRLAGLPFTCNSDNHAIVSSTALSLSITAGVTVTGHVQNTTDHIRVKKWSATTGTSDLTIAELSAGARLILTGTYIKA